MEPESLSNKICFEKGDLKKLKSKRGESEKENFFKAFDTKMYKNSMSTSLRKRKNKFDLNPTNCLFTYNLNEYIN